MSCEVKTKFYMINIIFHILCIAATIGCVSWCVWNYSLDLDVSLVEHREFGEEENYIKPAISVCFVDPFLKDQMKDFNPRINMSEYKDFLAGKHWTEEMSQINFENVTKKLEDFIAGYWVEFNNRDIRFHGVNSQKFQMNKPYVSYIGFIYNWMLKCYSVDVPWDVRKFGLLLKKEIFPNRIRTSSNGFAVSIHYPHQFIKSYENIWMNWPEQKNPSDRFYAMIFTLKSFEVTIRRNSKRQPCNTDWKKDDFKVSEQVLDSVKCRPPYNIWNSTYPLCNTKEKMALSSFFIGAQKDKFKEPCQSVEKIVYDYQDMFYDGSISKVESDQDFFNRTEIPEDLFWQFKDYFLLSLVIPSNRFKLIVHKKAYDFQNLIGNSGGYIGLFLGKSNVNFLY